MWHIEITTKEKTLKFTVDRPHIFSVFCKIIAENNDLQPLNYIDKITVKSDFLYDFDKLPTHNFETEIDNAFPFWGSPIKIERKPDFQYAKHYPIDMKRKQNTDGYSYVITDQVYLAEVEKEIMWWIKTIIEEKG